LPLNLAKKVMKITTIMLEDELYESTTPDRNFVRTDMRSKEAKEGQSPTELLLSSLAGCGAVDIVMILKKRRKTILKFEITTEGTRRETVPRSFTHIHSHYKVTSPDVEESELKKAAELSLFKYCSVGASLKSELTYSVEVIRP